MAMVGRVTFLSAACSKEHLPVGKTTHCRGMKIPDICPEYMVSLIRNGLPRLLPARSLLGGLESGGPALTTAHAQGEGPPQAPS